MFNDDNEYSLTIRKIKYLLKNLKHGTTIFTYKELRTIREEICKIKKKYKRFLNSADLQNISDIEDILEKLKMSHPHLCSKESYMFYTQNVMNKSTKNEQIVKKGSGKIQKKCEESTSTAASMELDKTLMSANNKKRKAPIGSEREDVKKKKPLVASQKVKDIRSAEGFDENLLSSRQKLYLQALEVWEAIDKYEARKNAKKQSSINPYFFS